MIDLRPPHQSQPTANALRVGPMNVDDGLEDIRWIRGPGGERLPAASYALLPSLKKGLFLVIGKGLRICAVCFLHVSAQMCTRYVSDTWPAPGTYHRPCREHYGQRVDRSP